MALVYHGTPMSPRAALLAQRGRSFCVSFYRPDSVADVEAIAPFIMYDNGAFSFWMKAVREGVDPTDAARFDWADYFEWLEARLFVPGRWAIIPDAPGAPSQLNDGLLNDWPHGDRGAPVWHMNGPLERLGKLCERYSRVCLGWVGDGKAEKAVGCDAYRRRMDEVAAMLGNSWPPLHMLRGVAVGGDYPFLSADSTSLAQNGWKFDWMDTQGDMFESRDRWHGRGYYADRLEIRAA